MPVGAICNRECSKKKKKFAIKNCSYTCLKQPPQLGPFAITNRSHQLAGKGGTR